MKINHILCSNVLLSCNIGYMYGACLQKSSVRIPRSLGRRALGFDLCRCFSEASFSFMLSVPYIQGILFSFLKQPLGFFSDGLLQVLYVGLSTGLESDILLFTCSIYRAFLKSKGCINELNQIAQVCCRVSFN